MFELNLHVELEQPVFYGSFIETVKPCSGTVKIKRSIDALPATSYIKNSKGTTRCSMYLQEICTKLLN